MPYTTRLHHPGYSATDVTVWRIDGPTALISDNAQRVRRRGIMVRVIDLPDGHPSRWWVKTSTLGNVQTA